VVQEHRHLPAGRMSSFLPALFEHAADAAGAPRLRYSAFLICCGRTRYMGHDEGCKEVDHLGKTVPNGHPCTDGRQPQMTHLFGCRCAACCGVLMVENNSDPIASISASTCPEVPATDCGGIYIRFEVARTVSDIYYFPQGACANFVIWSGWRQDSWLR
jgi:hypothetical protein